MIQHNGKGKPSPTAAMARDMSEVAQDVVELAELQLALAKFELRGLWKKVLPPVMLCIVASVIAASCVLVLLLSVACALVELGNLSWAVALVCVGAAGLALAGLIGFSGWKLWRAASKSPFDRSSGELTRNLQWFKSSLKDATRTPHGGHVPRNQRNRSYT